jgi:uncharacterized protein (DUF362 family)
MKRISRRKFLSLLSQSAGAAAVFQLLEACGIKPAATPGTPTVTPFPPVKFGVDGGLSVANAPGSTASPSPAVTPASTAEPAAETVSPEAEAAYLAVARGGDDPEALTRAAVAAIGGISRFVRQGANVLIKPNICTAPNRSYQSAATTNPWVVGALVKMCFEAGAAKVLVYDYPFGALSTLAYPKSGIADQVAAAGGQMEYVDTKKFIPTDLPNGQSLHSAAFYSEVIDADVVINVPIAKTHSTTGLTLGMKNMMGVVLDRSRAIHADIHPRIADLVDFIRPELTVIDAVRILIANGPVSTSLSDVRKIDTVIASADVVAADSYATRLFSWSDPNRLGYIKIGAERGLGRSDLDNLKIDEINLA